MCLVLFFICSVLFVGCLSMEGVIIIHTNEMENNAVIKTSFYMLFDITQVIKFSIVLPTEELICPFSLTFINSRQQEEVQCPLMPQFYPLFYGTWYFN